LKGSERNAETVKELILKEINKEPLAKISYVEIVDSSSLKPIQRIESSVLIAIAVYIGKTKLIDNFTFEI
jgi:pantoate--beta-alanine ligase